MYIYLNAIGKLKGRRTRWREVDVEDLPLNQLYETYSRLWLILTHTSLSDGLDPGEEVPKVSLDMELVRSELSWKEITVAEWLVENDDSSLPTISDIPELNNVTVEYGDAWRSNYDIEPVKPGVHPDVYYPQSEKTDLLITREGTDYQRLYDNCLVTVNGFIHQTSYSEHGLYVSGGATSGRIANRNQVGIIDFEEVGKLTPVQITEEMIYYPKPDYELKHGIYLNVNRDLTGKTLFLVLGGYLHMLDNTYQMVGDSLVKINLHTFPLPQRLFESMKNIDISSLELPEYQKNETLLSVDEIYSDEVLINYLRLTQSFFLIVDAEDVYVEKHQLEHSRLSGRWYAHTQPKYPLQKSSGKLEDYIHFEEEGVWVVACDNNFDINYNYKTTQWKDGAAIDATKSTTHPRNWSRGYFLEIGKDL